MTPATTWIRKNMIQSPGSGYSNNDRTLTEPEMKVQRCIRELSTPKWYLDNCSRPLKILTNDTPIESRPSAWKKPPLDKTTVNRNGVLETEIGPRQIYGTYRKNRNQKTEKSPIAKKRSGTSPKSHVSEKKSSRSRKMNVSQTFPRISPSRKIPNINIVFSQSPNNCQSQRISGTDRDDSRTDTTEDSPEMSVAPEVNNGELETSRLDNTSLISNSSETKISRMPNQQLTYIKPWKSPNPRVTPDKKFSSFEPRASSLEESPVSKFSESTVVASTPNEKTSLISSTLAPEASKEVRKPPPVPPRSIKPMSNEDEDTRDACKADTSGGSSPSPSHGRPSSGFRPRSLLPDIEEKRPGTPKQRVSAPRAADSRKEARKNSKSLVREIIEELNERCKRSTQPTRVTPGPKNFVKKLVEALENGTLPGRVGEEEDEVSRERSVDRPEDAEGSSEGSSEDEARSAAASTSISYKDTDSSDSELRSPTVEQNYNYDWNMNVEKNMNETVTISETSVSEKEEESVYWIPMAKSNLPRTSSPLSAVSRSSTSSPGPCVSPIKPGNGGGKSQTPRSVWGMTYRKSNYARTLRRIDETTILDSGYSDRSRGHSSGSSDGTWFDDAETTQTASENGSFDSFTLGSYVRRSRAQFLGRPFVI